MLKWLRRLGNWLEPEVDPALEPEQDQDKERIEQLVSRLRKLKLADPEVRCILALDKIVGRTGTWFEESRFYLDPHLILVEEADIFGRELSHGPLDEKARGILRELLRLHLDLFDLIIIGNNGIFGIERASIIAEMVADVTVRGMKTLIAYNTEASGLNAREKYEDLGIFRSTIRARLDTVVQQLLKI